jgi:hypothetical protein
MRHHPYDHRWRERWERKQKKRMQRVKRMRRDQLYRWRVHHRWHQRWHRHHARFKYSLGARLIGVFLVLALVSSVILWNSRESSYGLLWAVPARARCPRRRDRRPGHALQPDGRRHPGHAGRQARAAAGHQP